MIIRWSPEARDDVDRLADFVAAYDPIRAGEIEQELSQAPKRLLQFPRRGPRLSEFGSPSTKIHLCDQAGVIETVTLGDLLPKSFAMESPK